MWMFRIALSWFSFLSLFFTFRLQHKREIAAAHSLKLLLSVREQRWIFWEHCCRALCGRSSEAKPRWGRRGEKSITKRWTRVKMFLDRRTNLYYTSANAGVWTQKWEGKQAQYEILMVVFLCFFFIFLLRSGVCVKRVWDVDFLGTIALLVGSSTVSGRTYKHEVWYAKFITRILIDIFKYCNTDGNIDVFYAIYSLKKCYYQFCL